MSKASVAERRCRARFAELSAVSRSSRRAPSLYSAHLARIDLILDEYLALKR